ncbi:MAG: DNA polymerase I [Chloroflexi bacterium]|nr:DNA polymerase I [Chloroflexota bacterium]
MTPKDQRRLIILDGHGLIFRAYHAIKEPLTVRSTGEVVTAVYGFANTLLSVLDELKPTHVAVALDPPGPTFRDEMDATYKANRFEALKQQVARIIKDARAPDELKEQLVERVTAAAGNEEVREAILKFVERVDAPEKAKAELRKATAPVDELRDIVVQTKRIVELIEAFDIPIYMVERFEADDVLGTLAAQASDAGVETYLVTLDSDIIQLVREDVKVFMMRPYQHDTVTYDTKSAKERYQIEPQQMTDLKGLKGDTSDNIPGVPGIGDKTAVKLLQQFATIEEIYERIDQVTPEKLRKNLIEHEAEARHSKEMATIHTGVPVTLDLDACELKGTNTAPVRAFFERLEFHSILARLAKSEATEGDAPPPAVKAGEETEYRTIYTEEELDNVVQQLASAEWIAFDTETTGKSALHSSLVGISLSWAPEQAAYIPVGHRPGLGDREQLPVETVLKKLTPIMADEDKPKVAHNAKFDMEVLAGAGLEVRGVTFDTMVAAYLLGEGGSASMRPAGGSLGLKWLSSKRLGIEMTPITDLIGTGAKQITMADVSVEQASPYASADADMTGRLRPMLETELKEQDLWPLFEEIEMPLVSVLARMEQAGVAIDAKVLRNMSLGMGEQVIELEKQAYASVGHEFKLGSPQQLSILLFEELGLPKTRRTKQGYTTDATALEGLRGAHDVIDVILEWRQITKLKSTYVDALPALVHPKTGRIHSNFNQTVAATGRLSSQDPNLQNIPVRTEMGNAIRRCFIARDYGPKPVLLAADYSQIELRILAHLSQDEKLITAFQNDEDIHAATASQVFGVEQGEVTAEQRRRAKVFNFGVLYGLSEFGLAQREGISRDEAAQFIETYFSSYPKVGEWRESVIESCRKLGYAETLAGRRRFIPEVRSTNGQVRAAGERVAINMPVQGTASDIIKIAMNKIDAELCERGLATKMILQVHDELIFEGPLKERDEIQEMVLRIMPASLKLAVPVKVDIKVGKNWGELEEVPAVASAGGA